MNDLSVGARSTLLRLLAASSEADETSGEIICQFEVAILTRLAPISILFIDFLAVRLSNCPAADRQLSTAHSDITSGGFLFLISCFLFAHSAPHPTQTQTTPVGCQRFADR